MNNKPHFCPDWDEMLIYPGCAEMTSCSCDTNDAAVAPGSKVKTSFYYKECDKVRIVASCVKTDFRSQSDGWYIATEDGIYADAGWFREP